VTSQLVLLVFRYTPIKTCLHKVPAAIEQRGTDWPEEWPKRLETFPDWLGDSQEKLHADDHHWKAIFNRSYLNGMGIDWSNIRNVMDMKAIYGGYAYTPLSCLCAIPDFYRDFLFQSCFMSCQLAVSVMEMSNTSIYLDV